MGEYEPEDSRNVTLRQNRAPGEPPRTGPRENEARAKAEESAEGRKGAAGTRNTEEARKPKR